MPSGAENPTYHRSTLIKSFTTPDAPETLFNDFFGSSYSILFKNSVRNFSPYIIRQRDRLDQLSYVNYGTTSLWWAIALYNPNIYHPLILNAGDTINIPSKADIDAFLLAFKNGEVNAGNNTVQV